MVKKHVNYVILLTIILLIIIFINIPKKDNKKIERTELLTIEEALKNDPNYKIDKSLLGSSYDGDYKKIFNKDIIQEVNIDVDEYNYKYLLDNAREKPNVLANEIIIGDKKVKYPSIKTKGNVTLYNLIDTNTKRYSYTINFKKYLKDQNLYGLKKISFNNMHGDPTLMKEYISYYLFSEMGLDTVEYSYVNLSINNKNLGPYFMIEPIEKPLINRTMNENGDFLFKPGIRGATLVYNKKMDKYLDKKGNFNFDSILYDEKGNLDYPRNSNYIITEYNDIWDDDPEEFAKIINQLPTFFKTLKELNELSNTKNKNTKEYEKRLYKIIDVDKLIRYLAINVYLVNTDSYLSETKTNYGLYMNENGKLTIIPWDYNMIFGTDFYKDLNDVINFNIYNPVVRCKMIERPLINVILKNENLKKKYLKYLKDVTIIASSGGKTSDGKTYEKDNLNNIINKYGDDLINKSGKSSYSFYTEEEIKTAQTNIKEIINLRSEAVNNQIDKNNRVVKASFDISSLGSQNIENNG